MAPVHQTFGAIYASLTSLHQKQLSELDAVVMNQKAHVQVLFSNLDALVRLRVGQQDTAPLSENNPCMTEQNQFVNDSECQPLETHDQPKRLKPSSGEAEPEGQADQEQQQEDCATTRPTVANKRKGARRGPAIRKKAREQSYPEIVEPEDTQHCGTQQHLALQTVPVIPDVSLASHHKRKAEEENNEVEAAIPNTKLNKNEIQGNVEKPADKAVRPKRACRAKEAPLQADADAAPPSTYFVRVSSPFAQHQVQHKKPQKVVRTRGKRSPPGKPELTLAQHQEDLQDVQQGSVPDPTPNLVTTVTGVAGGVNAHTAVRLLPAHEAGSPELELVECDEAEAPVNNNQSAIPTTKTRTTVSEPELCPSQRYSRKSTPELGVTASPQAPISNLADSSRPNQQNTTVGLDDNASDGPPGSYRIHTDNSIDEPQSQAFGSPVADSAIAISSDSEPEDEEDCANSSQHLCEELQLEVTAMGDTAPSTSRYPSSPPVAANDSAGKLSDAGAPIAVSCQENSLEPATSPKDTDAPVDFQDCTTDTQVLLAAHEVRPVTNTKLSEQGPELPAGIETTEGGIVVTTTAPLVSKSSNLVAAFRSFLPWNPTNKATTPAIAAGKKPVKVKALGAALAVKRAEELKAADKARAKEGLDKQRQDSSKAAAIVAQPATATTGVVSQGLVKQKVEAMQAKIQEEGLKSVKVKAEKEEALRRTGPVAASAATSNVEERMKRAEQKRREEEERKQAALLEKAKAKEGRQQKRIDLAPLRPLQLKVGTQAPHFKPVLLGPTLKAPPLRPDYPPLKFNRAPPAKLLLQTFPGLVKEEQMTPMAKNGPVMGPTSLAAVKQQLQLAGGSAAVAAPVQSSEPANQPIPAAAASAAVETEPKSAQLSPKEPQGHSTPTARITGALKPGVTKLQPLEPPPLDADGSAGNNNGGSSEERNMEALMTSPYITMTAAQRTPATKPVVASLQYEISPYRSDSEEDDLLMHRSKKTIPTWAYPSELMVQLQRQHGMDPDKVFRPAKLKFNLEDVFVYEPPAPPPPGTDANPRHVKRDWRKRGSSGNWFADRMTWQEDVAYKRAMGYLDAAPASTVSNA